MSDYVSSPKFDPFYFDSTLNAHSTETDNECNIDHIMHCECKYYMRKEDPPSSVSVLSSEVPKLESDRIPILDDVITLDLGRIMLAVLEPAR